MAQACLMSRPIAEQQLLTPGKQPLSPQPDNSLITSTVRKRKSQVLPGEAPASPLSEQHRPAVGEDGKRQRTPSIDRGLNDGIDGVVRLQLASPAAALKHAAATPDALFASGDAAGSAGAAQADEEGGQGAGRQQQPGLPQHAHSWGQQQQTHHHHSHHLAQQHNEGRRASSPALAEEEDLLFSPVFHLCREGSRPDLADYVGDDDGTAAAAAAAGEAHHAATSAAVRPAGLPPRPPAAASGVRADTDNTNSTDHSTGTSACLADGDLSDADAASADLLHGDGAAAAVADDAAAPCSPAPPAPLLAVEAEAEAAGAGEGGDGEVDGDEYLEFDPLLFIKRLPPLERCVPARREFLLPPRTRRSKQKTLVLDLDETLVHSTLDGYCRPDFTFPVEVGSMRHMVSVRQRPHLHTFLERMAQLYEVVVFTASQRVYAEQLLNIVDPQRRLVRHRVYRESCVFWEGNYLKDLTVLGRDLAHTIIVDNSPQAFGFQIDNGIPIESWYDDDDDDELLKLQPFLEQMAHAQDVRPHIQKRFRLRRLVEAAPDPEQQYLLQQAQQLAQQAQQQP